MRLSLLSLLPPTENIIFLGNLRINTGDELYNFRIQDI